MLKKYIVTIKCDETTQIFLFKSKLTHDEIYNIMCNMYDEFDYCIINETNDLTFHYAHTINCNDKLQHCTFIDSNFELFKINVN